MNTEELGIARRIRRALDESLQDLPSEYVIRLQASRKRALQHHGSRTKPIVSWAPAFALLAGGSAREPMRSWLSRAATVLPIVALVFGLCVVYDNEMRAKTRERAEFNAELDAMVLSDTLPLEAYTDAGFAGYLAKYQDSAEN